MEVLMIALAGTALLGAISFVLGKYSSGKKELNSDPVNIPIRTRVRQIEVDPENPPRVMIYNPSPGFNEVYKCSCCNEEIKKGQEVIWFPVKDSDAVELYCNDKVEISEQDS